MQNIDKVLIEKLEDLNKEYLSSEYYQLGKYMKYLMNLLKKRRYIKCLQLLLLHFKNKKNKKEIRDIKKNEMSTQYYIKSENHHRIAIYTCITGNYDSVEEPLVLETGCDYFLFTNNKKIKSNNWKILDIPGNIKKIGDNAKINRYIKMHPKELFNQYDYAIYIDGNIKLISTISSFIEKIDKKTGLAIHRHCVNKCILDEIKTCRAYGKGNYRKLKKQGLRYKKEGFPKNYGMLECNVLVSNLNNTVSTKIFNEWWNEYIQSESMRDQIALPYVLWKNNIKIEEVGNLGNNVNKNYKIKINSHLN